MPINHRTNEFPSKANYIRSNNANALCLFGVNAPTLWSRLRSSLTFTHAYINVARPLNITPKRAAFSNTKCSTGKFPQITIRAKFS